MFGEVLVQCPYCFESIAVGVDSPETGNAIMVEDCSVCCRPIELRVKFDRNGECRVDARRENG